MAPNIDAVTERFDKALRVLIRSFGPQLIQRIQLGLTPGQVFMLHFIQQENHCSVSKLAEKMEVAPSAITVMLDRLENHGFVSRTRDQADRRVVVVELTDAGRETLKKVKEKRKQIMQDCLTQIDLKELTAIAQSLEKIASIAETMEMKSNSQEGE